MHSNGPAASRGQREYDSKEEDDAFAQHYLTRSLDPEDALPQRLTQQEADNFEEQPRREKSNMLQKRKKQKKLREKQQK